MFAKRKYITQIVLSIVLVLLTAMPLSAEAAMDFHASGLIDDKFTTYCGNIIYEDGALSQILFDGGYATLDDDGIPQYHFYLRDHLGNNRVVARADGTIEQVNHYYPFGGLMGESTGGDEQRYKYNGKEFDKMNGLNTYDYGARQHDPILARWDRIDPLAEKNPGITPYHFCHNNPINRVDPDGKDDYYTTNGTYIGKNDEKTDYVYVCDNYKKLNNGQVEIRHRVGLADSDISAKALSKIFTHIVGEMPEVDLNKLDGKQINVVKWSRDNYSNSINVDDQYGNCNDSYSDTNASTQGNNITVYWGNNESKNLLVTRSNIQNMLGVEEYTCHYKNKLDHYKSEQNDEIIKAIMSHPTWGKTTDTYKKSLINYLYSFK